MADQGRAGDDGYMECSIYAEHGACSCSTGVPGNRCPLTPLRTVRCRCGRMKQEGFICDFCFSMQDEGTVARG